MYFSTHSPFGAKFNLSTISEDDIHLSDIVLALPNLCRYNGLIPFFYSVAQHSTILCNYILQHVGDVELAKYALLHDASEAYVGDLIYPLKRQAPTFTEFETRISNIIFKKYGIDSTLADTFEEYDRRIAMNEMVWLDLIKPKDLPLYEFQPLNPSPHFIYMDPNSARQEFYNSIKKMFPNEHIALYPPSLDY